jgi:molybdopterin synthase catalytic subunit
MTPLIRIQREDFSLQDEIDALGRGRADIGAVVSFTGLCRDEAGRLAALELEHYPGMAEAETARVAAEAAGRWPLLGLVAIHRYGLIRPGSCWCWRLRAIAAPPSRRPIS